MSQPTPYTRHFSFTNDQTANPSTKTPGNQLDIEYNAILLTLNQTLSNLALIQRDDGQLANESVGLSQLKPEVSAGVSPATLWASVVSYQLNNIVFFGLGLYRCLVAHISGVFATDLAAGKWLLIGDMTPPIHTLTNDRLIQRGALTVMGNATNATADVADIAGTANQVLRVNGAGTALAFGSLDLAQTATVGTTVLGKANGGSGFANALNFTSGKVLSVSNTLTLAGTDGKTLTVSNSLTLAGTDGTIQTFPSTSGTVVTSVSVNAVTNAMRSQMAAFTLKGNATGSTANEADISIPALTHKVAPTSADLILVSDTAASGALKYSSIAEVVGAVSSGVVSIAGNTGAFTLDGGVTNDVNKLVMQQGLFGGRLTLTSSTPVTTTDVVAATTVYYAPAVGQWVPIYNGTQMRLYQFTSSATDAVGLAIALGASWAANTNYDWFITFQPGFVTFGTGPAWTSDTARGTGAGTTELQMFNGIWTNKNSMTLRNGNASTVTVPANQATYIGTTRTVAAGQMEDSMAKRFVWNAYNQVTRVLKNVTETTSSWSYTTVAWRQANANAANQLDMVIGLSGSLLDARVIASADTSAGGSFATVGIGINSTTVNSAQDQTTTVGLNRTPITAGLKHYPAIGRQFYAWLEASTVASGTNTFEGQQLSGGLSNVQSGISGTMLM
jgi:hypothetical protein